jgi:hypothetical protein
MNDTNKAVHNVASRAISGPMRCHASILTRNKHARRGRLRLMRRTREGTVDRFPSVCIKAVAGARLITVLSST